MTARASWLWTWHDLRDWNLSLHVQYMYLFTTCAPVASWIVTSPTFFDKRFFTFAGIGFSMSFVGTVVILHLRIRTNYQAASGFASLGVAVGIMSGALLFQFLIDNYSWRGCMLIFGGLQLNGLIFAPFMKVRTCCSFEGSFRLKSAWLLHAKGFSLSSDSFSKNTCGFYSVISQKLGN